MPSDLDTGRKVTVFQYHDNLAFLDYTSEEEKVTDDYFVLEGDISSTGGYITLMR